MKTQNVIRFIRVCVDAIEAGGYEDIESDDVPIPDDIRYNGEKTIVVFGSETFEISVIKRRRKS